MNRFTATVTLEFLSDHDDSNAFAAELEMIVKTIQFGERFLDSKTQCIYAAVEEVDR